MIANTSVIAALSLLEMAAATTAGCALEGESRNDASALDCRTIECEWKTIEGNARIGPTWTLGDIGVDLSGEGRAVMEERALLGQLWKRQISLDTTIVRDPGVRLQIQFDWYSTGQGGGKTYWAKNPNLLTTKELEIAEDGVFRLHRELQVPAEATGLVIRLIKEGNGRAMVDELSLGYAKRGGR